MRLISFLLFASTALCLAEEPLVGRWEGLLQVPGRETKVIVDVEQAGSGGGWSGSVIIPSMSVYGAALADIARNGSDITFAMKTALTDPKNVPAKFNARLIGDGKLAGDFVQAGNSAPFTLEKIGPPQLDSPPHSTPIEKELEGEWKGGYELFGYPRKVTLKLRNRGAEGAAADFVIVGKKENKLPVDLVTQEGPFLAIDSHETGLSFEGRASKDEIKGTIIQGPLEIPVVLKREK